MRCASCQHDNDDTKKFCTSCGAALGGKRCAQGHTIPDGLTECPFCPRPVRAATAMEAPAPQAAPRRQGTALVSNTELERSGVQVHPNASSLPRVASGNPVSGPALGAAAASAPSGRGRTVFRSPDAPSGPAETLVPAPASAPVAARPTAQSAFPSPLVGFLVSFSLDPNGQHWPVRFGRTSIGTEVGCEIVIAAPGVSGRHAEVMVRDNKGVPKIWVSDNNSTNGTQLNGSDIFTDRPDLTNGAQVSIAGVEFVFVALPAPASA